MSEYYNRENPVASDYGYDTLEAMPKHAVGEFEKDPFSLYVDEVMEKSKLNWQEQVVRDRWRDQLKNSICVDQERNQKMNQLIREMEADDRQRNIEEEFRRREEQLKKMEEGEEIWSPWSAAEKAQFETLNQEEAREQERHVFKRLPLRVKPYYLE